MRKSGFASAIILIVLLAILIIGAVWFYWYDRNASVPFPNVASSSQASSTLIVVGSNTTQSILVPVDANFDGYEDLPILNQCGATGNCTYDFYLYNTSTNQFVENDFLSSLGTFSIDATKKQVTTYSNGSYWDWEIDTYQYANGQYTLIQKQISALTSSSSDNGTVMVSFYQLQNGKMQLVHSTTTSSND
jgi:hypothetical protein